MPILAIIAIIISVYPPEGVYRFFPQIKSDSPLNKQAAFVTDTNPGLTGVTLLTSVKIGQTKLKIQELQSGA